MARSWSDILVDAIISTAVGRIKRVVVSTGALLGTIASFFPVPGPDADARFSAAVLDLADSFDVLDQFVIEVSARTVAQLPIPKEYSNRVIRGDVAVRIAILALADGIQSTGSILDTPAENLQRAVLVKQARFFVKQSWATVTRQWSQVVLNYIGKLFSLSPLKFLSYFVRLLDIAVKTIMGVAGLFLALRFLNLIQKDYDAHFLSQSAPRVRVRTVKNGLINRREPGGVPP